ncbi:hypothetical protein Bca4012_096248 [Brassica carinata]
MSTLLFEHVLAGSPDENESITEDKREGKPHCLISQPKELQSFSLFSIAVAVFFFPPLKLYLQGNIAGAMSLLRSMLILGINKDRVISYCCIGYGMAYCCSG